MSSFLNANIDRFSGFADLYDQYRPQPPAIIVDLLRQLAQATRPQLVVDLGCGTGLSTRIWAGHAEAVIGIEPNADMCRQAEALSTDSATRYQDGLSTQTNLPDGRADIVTVSQALHWMEPAPTFVEIARILHPGGVFAAYDCDWPPAMHWEAEQAYQACMDNVSALEKQHHFAPVHKWPKHQHLANLHASGHFRYVREITVHQIEEGNAARLVGLALSQGGLSTLLRHGVSEGEIGIDQLREVAERTIGEQMIPWHFSYRVRVGVK